MKKTLLLLCLSGITLSGKSQIVSQGTLDTNRKLINTQEVSFTIENSASQGHIVVECAVNREGVVTSTKTIAVQSSLKSTPSIMKAENLAKKLKFTSGTVYAPFEHVRVKYTFNKPASN